jgi:hypothetical protein
MLTPRTKEIPQALAATDRDTFIDRSFNSKTRLSTEYNYGLFSEIEDSNTKFTLDARTEGRSYSDTSRLNATVFEDPTSTVLYLDGGGEHTTTVPPEAVVLFVCSAIEHMDRRPHEVNVSAIRHNLTELQMSALGEVGFAGFSKIPPDEAIQASIPSPSTAQPAMHK